ncbi:hypothetical protein C8D87_11663 [Lentzea atacamensis]|uniref:Uncharacterized protein n=1 Tax=Lentzea atacamensis TaxID=531938 RepID=A0ABX9DVV5_9PSEU|nr:hypothetical protein [Lentzea atacamensis]RAS59010.1 hypothetical protein C8D87_11663 [Lentzea atacamensis]
MLDRAGHTVDLSDADARFRQWMHDNLSHAADHFGLTVAGQASGGVEGKQWTLAAPLRKLVETL